MSTLAEDLSVEVAATQLRLRGLLEANRLVVEHLDLPSVLRQIVEAAVELVGAAYGAVGILGSDGKFGQFIHVGMDAKTVEGIGQTPVGLGLLGALIDDPRPVRLATMTGDSPSVGSLRHHPRMSSFLGVPLEVRGEVFGHLYLADPRVDAFSHEDQELVEALAATAGVAIAHARLFEESRRRELWTAASMQVTHELLTNEEVDAPLLIAERVLELADADLVAVILSNGSGQDDDGLSVHRAVGRLGEAVVGTLIPRGDTLVRRCLTSRRPQLVEEIDAGTRGTNLPKGSLGPAMALPLLADGGVRGSLFVLRDKGSARFTEFDLDVAASFAGQATLALERCDARVVRGRVKTLEDRDRIARDLHDHVVQRLFAVGLNIQTVCAVLGRGSAADRLVVQIDEIDATIRQIRNTIFGLHTTRNDPESARARILQAIDSARVTLPRAPDVDFRGPVDLLVPSRLCGDAVAVVREALTNVGRHADARRVQVLVTADARSLSVEVLDDGKGVREGTVLSGLRNLRSRAEALGGSFHVADRAGPGTHLTWVVPLGPPDE